MNDIRKAAVASMFYPDDTVNLKRMINSYLSSVPENSLDFFKKNSIDQFFGIIVPHAGYIYSGSTAAHAYSLLKQKSFDTIVLIGPSHFSYFQGFALSYFKAFESPFGKVEVDLDLVQRLAEKGAGVFDFVNTAHIKEHSLEVQLPFLQTVLEEKFQIVPILMGEQSWKGVKDGVEVLSSVLKEIEKRCLFVISSDLSHYHEDKTAREMDEAFIKKLEKMDSAGLMEEVASGKIEACGAGPIATFLETAKKLNRNKIKKLVYKNSGDTSGDYSRVVGYLSAVVW
jgi:AmmeMemoRadiSam system protein B